MFGAMIMTMCRLKTAALGGLCFWGGLALADSPDSPAARTFSNPILPGFHADPSITRVGDDYYLVTSSFEYFPGVPIFHSRDLVHWRQIGHVLTRKSQLNLEGVRASHGVFAPTIRHHNGVFHMIATVVGGGGNFYVTATNAAGPWSEPVWLDRAGIDPSLYFADDGKVYYTRQADGERGYISQQLLNLQTGRLEGQRKELWRGTGGVWPEGPHLDKVNGKYYLMISEGGTSYDHMVTVARSDSPWGPFEANPKNPILTHRHLPEHPFQGLGQVDLVETPDGWWAVFLGYRPQGGRHHHLGREAFLAPVTWEDGWPVINGGNPIPPILPAPNLPPHPWPAEPARDEFDSPILRPAWTHVRNPDPRNYSLTERPGWLRLRGAAVTLNEAASPTFLGRRQTHLTCQASVKLSFQPRGTNEEAGLVLRGNDRNHCAIFVTLRDGKRQVALRKFLDGRKSEPIEFQTVPDGDIVLAIESTPLHYHFYWSAPGGAPRRLGAVPTRALSTETLSAQPGANFNFTGVFIGMFATGNGRPSAAPADFDWFDLQAPQTRSLFREAGIPDYQVEQRVQSAFQQLFHGDPATETVFYAAGANANGPLAFIYDVNNGDVRTEGISYGMMIAVQLDRKAEFDALWNWAKTHMQQTNRNHPAFGYFAWSVSTNGVPNDEMPAPDGEEYFATALLFADERWGSGQGIYNYRAEAHQLLTDMLHRQPITGRTVTGEITGLAMFHPGHKMVRFTPDKANSEHTNPSYHLPAFYEVWARHGPERDRAFWRAAAAVSRDYFHLAAHPVTGLTPEYGNFDGTPWSASWHRGSSNFLVDAWRTGKNWAMDWSWWRADPRQRELSHRLLGFFESQGITNHPSRFTLDGRPLNRGRSAGLVAMNASAGLAADPERAKPFVLEFWNTPVPTGRFRYYDGMLYLLGLLHCSGKFQNWSPPETR